MNSDYRGGGCVGCPAKRLVGLCLGVIDCDPDRFIFRRFLGEGGRRTLLPKPTLSHPPFVTPELGASRTTRPHAGPTFPPSVMPCPSVPTVGEAAKARERVGGQEPRGGRAGMAASSFAFIDQPAWSFGRRSKGELHQGSSEWGLACPADPAIMDKGCAKARGGPGALLNGADLATAVESPVSHSASQVWFRWSFACRRPGVCVREVS